MSHACVTRYSFTMGVTARRRAAPAGVGTLAYCNSVQRRELNDRHTLKSRNATLASTGYRALTIYEPENTSLMMWKRISDKCSLMSLSLSLCLSVCLSVSLSLFLRPLRASLFALWRCRVNIVANNSELLALDRYYFYNIVALSWRVWNVVSSNDVNFVLLMYNNLSNRTSIVHSIFEVCIFVII